MRFLLCLAKLRRNSQAQDSARLCWTLRCLAQAWSKKRVQKLCVFTQSCCDDTSYFKEDLIVWSKLPTSIYTQHRFVFLHHQAQLLENEAELALYFRSHLRAQHISRNRWTSNHMWNGKHCSLTSLVSMGDAEPEHSVCCSSCAKLPSLAGGSSVGYCVLSCAMYLFSVASSHS